MDPKPQKPVAPSHSGSSSTPSSPVLKLLIGCGCLTFVAIIVLAVATAGGVYWAFSKLGDLAEPFEAKGYRRVTGQVVSRGEPVEEPTVYTCQVVRLREGASADIALICQVAEIDGTVEGDIDFYGQVLKIMPGAVVQGDIRAHSAQVVDVQGRVEGKISGSYSVLKRTDVPAEKMEQ